jgi:flagellar hook-associated protein 2
MPTISLPGLSSGIDTNTLIQAEITTQSQALNMYKSEQTTWNNKITALNGVASDLKTFQAAVQNLSSAQDLRAFNAATSDSDILTADASSSGFEGNHTIEIKQLASAERIVHSGKPYAEDLVGAGKFIYSYNHKETTVVTTATTTLDDLVGLINNDPTNPGVTASLLQYDDGSGNQYHLVLSGNDSGSANQISINPTDTNVITADSPLMAGNDKAVGASKISTLDSVASADTITISGTKPDGTTVGPTNLTVTRDTTIDRVLSAINDAFGGSATATIVDGKIVLTDNACGTSQTSLNLSFSSGGTALSGGPTFSVTTQGGQVNASLAGFESSTFTTTQVAQDALIKVDNYPPGTDSYLARSSNTIDDVIPGVTLHLHAPTAAGSDVQVNLTRTTDDLKTRLNALVTAYNTVMGTIGTQTGYDTTTKTAGPLMGDYAVSSISNAVRSPLSDIAAGFSASDTFNMPSQLGFSIDKDGVLSLDQSQLDTAISTDYQGVLSLIGAQKTGTSTNSNIKFYDSGSYTAAGSYEVQATFDNGTLTGAKIRQVGQTTWRDATVSGNVITGQSGFDDTGQPLYPENGLAITADYSGSGTITATVNVKEGFAGTLQDMLNKTLEASDGTLTLDQQQASDEVASLQTLIDNENDRLSKLQTTLTDKYARLEQLLAQMQQQQQAVGK